MAEIYDLQAVPFPGGGVLQGTGRTLRVLAEPLKVSQSTVYALSAAGKLRCSRVAVGRGCIRILEEHLAAYLAVAATSSPPPALAMRRFRPKPIKLFYLRAITSW